jgi:hypothetical protein
MRRLWLALCVLLAVVGPQVTLAAKKAAPAPPAPANKGGSESSKIEEVTAKQLEKFLLDKDYVAVFWCKFLFLNFFSRKKVRKVAPADRADMQPVEPGCATCCMPFESAFSCERVCVRGAALTQSLPIFLVRLSCLLLPPAKIYSECSHA